MKSPLAAGALVFFTSASVLVLEILAGRILAPYVGVTLQTFTGIIGTVLAGIALGSWLGGRAADRGDPSRLLAPLLIGGGLLVVITPTVVTVLGPSLSGENPAQIVSLAFVGFFLPAAVLSAVSPTVAKIQLQTLDETGTVVGSLSALGTAGAIFGTFVTGFVLIAALPSRPITWAVGGALVAVGTVLAIRRGAGATVLSALALLALVVAGSAAVGGPCERETAYFCARVNVDPNRPTGRELILDTLRHSYVDLEDPAYLGSRYARVIADVIESGTAETHSVLYIGGGGFTLPRYFLATVGADATVLELDSTVVEIAETELGLMPGSWLRIEIGDARITLGDAPMGSYDAVVGDAFGGPSVPWHLTTEEFLIDVKARLRPGGVYAMNVIDHPSARFVRAEVATLGAVFAHVAVVAPPELLDGSTGGNFVLVASDTPIDGPGIESVITARSGREVVIIDAAALDFAAGARVLRDEYAPVDQLLGRP
jgi:spermidine synthase